MSACVAYITCIAQVTLEVINNTLFVNERWFCFFHTQFLFNFCADKHRLDGGVYCQAQILELFFHNIC